MKCQGNQNSVGRSRGWAPAAIAGAALLAAAVCGGCLYTIIPAMAGPSTTYQQSADSQPAAQPSPAPQATDPSNGQNKQLNGMPPNGAHPQGQGGTL